MLTRTRRCDNISVSSATQNSKGIINTPTIEAGVCELMNWGSIVLIIISIGLVIICVSSIIQTIIYSHKRKRELRELRNYLLGITEELLNKLDSNVVLNSEDEDGLA